jgi:hypothetical protein
MFGPNATHPYVIDRLFTMDVVNICGMAGRIAECAAVCTGCARNPALFSGGGNGASPSSVGDSRFEVGMGLAAGWRRSATGLNYQSKCRLGSGGCAKLRAGARNGTLVAGRESGGLIGVVGSIAT